jgi:transcription antitermination factor NusG
MKPLYVGREGRIISGVLAGHRGKVVAFDSETDEAIIQLDENTFVHISSEVISQDKVEQLTFKFWS